MTINGKNPKNVEENLLQYDIIHCESHMKSWDLTECSRKKSCLICLSQQGLYSGCALKILKCVNCAVKYKKGQREQMDVLSYYETIHGKNIW
jgi:hypothetical protein